MVNCTHVIDDKVLALAQKHGIMIAMYVETVPNRNSPPAILLREAYREDGKVKKRTLANLTDWPKDARGGDASEGDRSGASEAGGGQRHSSAHGRRREART